MTVDPMLVEDPSRPGRARVGGLVFLGFLDWFGLDDIGAAEG
jgi:hypothetical protein